MTVKNNSNNDPIVVPMFVKKNRQKQKKSVKICKFITQKKTANK